MSLPKALVYSTYRALVKHARTFDASAAKRTLIAAAPTRLYSHEHENWLDVDRSPDWDSARASVDEFIRRANRGKEMYVPPLPDDTDRSRHPLLDVIRSSYRERPNTSAAFNEAFSAVRLFSSAQERTQQLPAELPFPARDCGVKLTSIGDDGEWTNAEADAAVRVIVANPLLPGIFAHSIVCMIPPPPPPAAAEGDGDNAGDSSSSESTTRARSPMEGATGFIINKPLLNDQGIPVPIWAAFPADSPALFTETLANNVVMVGGPVGAIGNRETAVFVIHRVPGVTDAVPVAPGVWSSFRALDELNERIKADGVDPKHVMVIVGYAGWGRAQLGGEIENGSWFVAERRLSEEASADRDAEVKDIGDFVFSSNLVSAPNGETPDPATHPAEAAAALSGGVPAAADCDRTWCELLASWGPDHADLTRLLHIHKSHAPPDTASW